MKPTPTHPTGYKIRVACHLPPQWADWFEGLTLTLEADGNTLLTDPALDQAALYGVLKKVRDLGLALLSVSPVESEPQTVLGTDLADQLISNSEALSVIIKRLIVEFITVFAVALVTTAIVTYLWTLIGHGAGVIDWETSFRLALIFGIILTWVKSRETTKG